MTVGVAPAVGGADLGPELGAGLGISWDDPCMARVRSREMVGRDRDLATLLDLAEAARGSRPRLALVTGEAGIGKTRLVQEMEARLDDALVLTGHGVDLATGELPFGVVADTLADLLRQRGADVLTAEERSLLGPLLPGAAPTATDPARVLAGAVSLFGRLAGEGLVCWVVEDLQWADEASRDLVSVLARRESGQFLLVATVRSGGLAEQRPGAGFAAYLDGLVRLPAAETVTVERLGADDVRRQLADLLDDPLPPEVVRLILDVGDGVPFVVEELAAARGRPGLTTVAAVAEARLGALAGGARRLVEAAAVGDGQLLWPLLGEVVDLGPEELDEALLGAVRAGVLEETPGREGVRFRHALLRDAADRSIPPAARRGWHRRWAEAITARPRVLPRDQALLAVARHWHLAGDPEEEARSALAAVDAAVRTSGGSQELALWSRLLDLFPLVPEALAAAGVDRHTVLNNVLRLAMAVRGEAGIELLEQELERAVDDLERAAIRVRRIADGRPKGSLAVERASPELTEEWGRIFRAALPDPLARDGLGHLSALFSPDDPRSAALLAESRAAAEAAGDARTTLLIWARQAYLWQVQGRPDFAAAELERLIGEAQGLGTYELWSAEGNLMWCLGVSGRYAEVERAFDRACARLPDPMLAGLHFEHLVENVAFAWINTGQWDRAEELVRAARPYWGEGLRSSEVRLAEVELMRTGRLQDPARWRAAMAAGPVALGADPLWIAETVAWDAAGAGDLPEMRRILAHSWALDDPSIATDILWTPVLRAVRVEADAAVRRPDPGDRAAAEEHVSSVERVAEALHRWGDLGVAWDAEVTAQLARFRGEPCRELFEVAVAAWDRVGHPYDAAVARLCLAEAAATDGDREEARRRAEAALRTARDLGSPYLEATVEEVLARYRLASRGTNGAAGPGALTAREREVLAALAEGRTNEQIAGELYMSPKTASVHVSRILAKLGAENRTEAAAVARRIGLL